MSLELDVLKDVAEKLNTAGIPYFISGSVAMSMYAQPRMTRDIDIVLTLHEPDADSFVKLFEKEYYIEPDTVRDEIARNGMFNVINNQSIVKVDFIIKNEGEFTQNQFKRRRNIDIDGVKVWVVSPEDLVISKLLWAKDSESEMQLKDVKNILDTVEILDMDYIQNWVRKYNLSCLFDRINT